MKLTAKQMSQAYQSYARRHGFSVSTVRACTSVRIAALREYKAIAQGEKNARKVIDILNGLSGMVTVEDA